MDEIKRRFAEDIGAKLAAAPESAAKAEMIEELADNLARRYEDMTAAGVAPEDAYARAMEQLGSVEELSAYLEGLEPEGTDAAGADGESFFRAVGDICRAAGDIAREAAGIVGGTFRGAAQEDRKDRTECYVNFNGKNAFHGADIPSGDLLRLDVEVTNGDVDICLSDEADGPVRVEGSDALEVFTAGDGTLTVREKRWASSQFFSFRGLSRTDVSLTIPARRWESIRVCTVAGDVDMSGGLEVGKLTLRTANGDLACRVKSCQWAKVQSASGDVHLEGDFAAVQVDAASGDVELSGPVGEANVTTASGDVELSGPVGWVKVRAMSGDVSVKSSALPAGMELSSKSGDVCARIPDSGPFSVALKSVSGDVHYGFPQWWAADAPAGEERPRYSLTSISGDVTLEKY